MNHNKPFFPSGHPASDYPRWFCSTCGQHGLIPDGVRPQDVHLFCPMGPAARHNLEHQQLAHAQQVAADALQREHNLIAEVAALKRLVSDLAKQIEEYRERERVRDREKDETFYPCSTSLDWWKPVERRAYVPYMGTKTYLDRRVNEMRDAWIRRGWSTDTVNRRLGRDRRKS